MRLTRRTLSVFIVVLGLLAACKASQVSPTPAGVVSGGPTGATAAASALSISANPNSIPSAGSTVVTANVVDILGNPVPDGTLVKFAFAPGDQLKARLSGSSAQTINGIASVNVTAANVTADTIATVNAVCGGATGGVAISITAGGSGGTITVSALPTTITALGSSTISAVVKDASNSPLANVTVTFSLNNATLASLSASTAITDATGLATVTLNGSAAGSVSVTATTVSLPGVTGSATVTITPASSVPTITVSAASANILTNNATTITAVLSGYAGSVSGLTVNFSLNNPAVATLSATSAVTNAGGIAQVTLTAGNIVSPVIVTASESSQGVSGSTTVTISAPPPDTVTLSANPASITVYGTTTLSALVTGNSTSVPDGTTVNFVLGDSTFGKLSNSVGSTVNGIATTTFIATNKAGSVTVSAVAGSVSNVTTITISPAATGSIQFVSAVPQVIAIKNSGGTEISTVTFAVSDINGNPVTDGTQVNFSMQGPGGGAYIGSTPGMTTATAGTVAGKASVLLHSGSVAGPVTIIASTVAQGGGTISSSASQISIGGGVASASHFNLATTQFNLPGLVQSNYQATISAYIADRFGNYNILQGTSISFYTEAGAIDRQGVTDSTGATSVVFRTQSPMPATVGIWDNTTAPIPGLDETTLINNLDATYGLSIPTDNTAHPRDGWVTVLAALQGEEAFIDENADGQFTQALNPASYSPVCPVGYTCECHDSSTNAYLSSISGGATCPSGWRSEGFVDIGEPFYDVNDDGCRNDGNTKNCNGTVSPSTDPFEQFIDTNSNGSYDPPNGRWDGPSCTTTGCQQSKMIWTSIKLAFTGNARYCAVTPSSISIPYASMGSFTFIVGDKFTNALVPGTSISVSSTQGTLGGTTNWTIPDGIPFGPEQIGFTLEAPSDPGCTPVPPATSCTSPPTPATVTITVTPPSGVVGCMLSVSGSFHP